ncbi:hypothetical protein STEG23_011238 [Scotinomys teguina]
MKFARKWKELENIILNEVTQTQKDKHGQFFSHSFSGHTCVPFTSAFVSPCTSFKDTNWTGIGRPGRRDKERRKGRTGGEEDGSSDQSETRGGGGRNYPTLNKFNDTPSMLEPSCALLSPPVENNRSLPQDSQRYIH